MFTLEPWMRRAGEHPADDAGYFELLARTIFSAGLGPKVVSSRWEAMKERFAGFEPDDVACLGPEAIESLLADPAVIRNRRKIEAVIANAERFQQDAGRHGGFHQYLLTIGAEDDLEGAAAAVADRYAHMGSTSAMLFLFSAGWRPGAPAGRGEDAEESEAVETA